MKIDNYEREYGTMQDCTCGWNKKDYTANIKRKEKEFAGFDLLTLRNLFKNYPQSESIIRWHLVIEYMKTNCWDTRNSILYILRRI